MKPDLSIEIAGIRMQNPVMNAAGTCDIEPEGVKELMGIERIGAFVQKSITLNPRDGNPQPRIMEVVAGVINRIGLQNIGAVEFADRKLDIIYGLLPSNIPLIVSVAGESIKDYLETAVILETKSKGKIAALEINVSCPNVKDGLIFGGSVDLLFDLVSTLKSKIALPLIVKLSPNVTDISSVAKAAVSAGADVLSLINTVRAATYIQRGPNAGQWIEGGFSGPAIKPIALYMVRQVSKVVEVPIIAMGGICDAGDALEFLRIRNVWAIVVGTAIFRDPSAMIKIIDGIEQYLAKKNYANISQLKEKEAR